MPYNIKYKPDKGGRPWKIINKETGRVVGSSKTRKAAEASVRARMAGEHGKKKS
jgi:hypothetical protein